MRARVPHGRVRESEEKRMGKKKSELDYIGRSGNTYSVNPLRSFPFFDSSMQAR